MQLKILSPGHPLWLAGFRPFFALAIFMGLLMPLFWGLFFSGWLSWSFGFNAIQWHAHEMFYGFSGAILIGFLLTASKNWVKIRGIHGWGLMLLVALWIFERFFIYYAFQVPAILKHLGMSVFLIFSAGYILASLLKHHRQDTFKDNYFFVILLGLIVVAKNLMLSDSYYQIGMTMTLGLYRLAFVVMFERTITQFMKNTENVVLYRNKILDNSIKVSILLSVFQSFYPASVAASLLSLAALLLMIRWFLWRPDLGFKKFGNATMYLGYMGLILHLIILVLQVLGVWSVGTTAMHLFTLLCLGIVVPSMVVRISQGHTGRKPEFKTTDQIAIFFLFLAAVIRVLLPLTMPQAYSSWILLAGLLWAAAYLMLGIRLMPFLFQARIDGKEH